MPRFRVVADADEVADFGFPCVLKTSRGGYDGRASGSCGRRTSAAPAFAAAEATGVRILAEERVDFRRELSALVARSPSGQAAAYPVVESVQRDGICARGGRSGARAVRPPRHRRRRSSPCGSPRELDVTGILAVELFETDDDRILVNELAMRPHNTGHWTQDGAVTSQFENHLRAVLDLPLGSPVTRAPVDGDGQHPRRPTDSGGRLYDGYPHALRPRPAAAGAPVRQGAPSRPQGRARQRLRRRPARVSENAPATPLRGSPESWETRVSDGRRTAGSAS